MRRGDSAVDSAYARLRRWAGLVSDYAIAQAAVQGLGLAAGLVLVNIMPVREYAFYTLALSIVSFISIASDLGVSNALLYFRRETRIAQTPFPPFVASALQMRRILLLAASGIATPFFWHAAAGQGFAAFEILATLAALLAAVWFQVHASVYLLLLRLAYAYRTSYVAETAGNACRLAGAIAMGLLSVTAAWLGVLIGALGGLLTLRVSRRTHALLSPSDIGGVGRNDKTHAQAILRYVVPTLASTLYFALQGPLMVWLSSYFGSAENIAEVGALGRMSVLFGMLLGFANAVVLPRLAGVTDEPTYLRRCLACWALLVPVGLGLLAAAAAAPHWLLWLLGANYAGLEKELLLVVLTASINLWGGFAVAVNNARGWVRWQSVVLVPYVVAQLALVMVLDLSTTYGVLLFGLWSAITGTALAVATNVIGFYRPGHVAVAYAPRESTTPTASAASGLDA